MAFSLRRLLTTRIEPAGPPPLWLQWLVLVGFAVSVSPFVYFVFRRMEHQRSSAYQIEQRQKADALKSGANQDLSKITEPKSSDDSAEEHR